MALTTLDAKTALIVIDLQEGIVALPVVHEPQPVIERCAALAAAFREKDLPVVIVNVAGGAPGRTESPRHQGELPANWATLVPAMTPQHNDITVTKHTWGAFNQTTLHDQLQKRGITQVVICGIATSIGVESTARQAYELGYNVTLAVDAMTDLNSDTHENSIKRIFPRLGETGSCDDVRAKLNAL
ncbi:nicotinamidase-related amidase [Pantoea sp. PNA 14-12]|uniref:isochorismatase family protein n=1 Tax=Pantoea TaxID=53335 RepID=UPI000542ACC1|nr:MULTISPECIES: isochorismatase family protein [Pantoea]KKW50023.1 hydrolase [Pantoea ananatis]KHE02271.1 hydrolase [Pantoea stewartii]KHN61747.1 hydrolase [Pantoea stewartii]KTS28030.1 hydrolase [Pantoea stewartii]MBC0853542.1 isochorismatase family protein [Pantoea stewartii]